MKNPLKKEPTLLSHPKFTHQEEVPMPITQLGNPNGAFEFPILPNIEAINASSQFHLGEFGISRGSPPHSTLMLTRPPRRATRVPHSTRWASW